MHPAHNRAVKGSSPFESIVDYLRSDNMCDFCENEDNYKTLGSMSISVGLFGDLVIDADLDVENNSIMLCASI